jgi:hypothetical protein
VAKALKPFSAFLKRSLMLMKGEVPTTCLYHDPQCVTKTVAARRTLSWQAGALWSANLLPQLRPHHAARGLTAQLAATAGG